MHPRACHQNMLAEELPDEILVYDARHDRAHCLNAAAGLVWRHADGKKSVGDLAELLERELKLPRDEAVVIMALHSLRQAGLLEDEPCDQPADPSRRAMLRRVSGAGVAVALLPAVTTLMVPGPAAAASGAVNGKGSNGPPDRRRRRLPPPGAL